MRDAGAVLRPGDRQAYVRWHCCARASHQLTEHNISIERDKQFLRVTAITLGIVQTINASDLVEYQVTSSSRRNQQKVVFGSHGHFRSGWGGYTLKSTRYARSDQLQFYHRQILSQARSCSF